MHGGSIRGTDFRYDAHLLRAVGDRSESGEFMDLSKLPRLSKTDTTPNDAGSQESVTAQPPPVTAYRSPGAAEPRPLSGMGIEAWLSIGVGLIFAFAFPHFTQWAYHTVFHTKHVPSFLPITEQRDDGSEVKIPYPKSIFFMNDLAIAVFAYALLIEGVALILARRAWVVVLALAVTIAAVALNFYYLATSLDQGFPIVSAIAIVFGGYMIWAQWQILQAIRSQRALANPLPTKAPGVG